MSTEKLALQPGVNTEATPTLASGTWAETNLVRWRDGFLEKIFGWVRLTSDIAIGIARAIFGFSDLNGVVYIAAGTNSALYLLRKGHLVNITPIGSTANIAVALSTTIGSTEVTITDASHGRTVGDGLTVVVPISVGGLIIHGDYEIIEVVGPNDYVIDAGAMANATVVSGGAVAAFATVSTTPTVTVTFNDHGYIVNDVFTVHVSTTVATVVLNGPYNVVTVINPNQFTITAASNANATTTGSENGGNARYEYLIDAGPVSTTALLGYGAGGYGMGTWGHGDTSGSVVYDPVRYWSLDSFGVDLLASPTNGPLYEWLSASSSRATLIATAPTKMTAMFVAMPQTQVVCLGAEVGGTQDPLLVRWSDAGTDDEFIATTLNQAGSYRLSNGSKIVGGLQAPLSGLIWTDSSLWLMNYVGYPFIFNFVMIAEGCGMFAPKAMGVLNRDVYWMSQQGFYRYGSGAPEAIPCDVWDTIFQNIDLDNMDKSFCAVNAHTSEVAWFYPSRSGGSGEIDAYVKMNTSGQWDYGPTGTLLARTAWNDVDVQGLPVSMTLDGHIVMQESGYDADGAAMTGVRAKSGFLDIASGSEMMKIDQVWPDFKMLGLNPEVQVKLFSKDNPNATEVEHGPYVVGPTTKFFSVLPAARGMQIAVEVQMDSPGAWFRLGAVRFRVSPDGKRAASDG